MAGSVEEVKAGVRAQVEGGDFVQRLAERIGAASTASAVFGDPVERAGLTVIPVAKAAWGFGGGSGSNRGQEGSGGGGGSLVRPLGYIEVRDEQAEFKPLRDRRPMTALAALAALAAVALAVRELNRN